jgi:hypothetical protein
VSRKHSRTLQRLIAVQDSTHSVCARSPCNCRRI